MELMTHARMLFARGRYEAAAKLLVAASLGPGAPPETGRQYIASTSGQWSAFAEPTAAVRKHLGERTDSFFPQLEQIMASGNVDEQLRKPDALADGIVPREVILLSRAIALKKAGRIGEARIALEAFGRTGSGSNDYLAKRMSAEMSLEAGDRERARSELRT